MSTHHPIHLQQQTLLCQMFGVFYSYKLVMPCSYFSSIILQRKKWTGLLLTLSTIFGVLHIAVPNVAKNFTAEKK